MGDRKKIILCEGTGCPLIETCAFYNPTMVKAKTDHWGIIPYDPIKGKCSWYEEIDIDEPINN
jgi:hypothetical protein